MISPISLRGASDHVLEEVTMSRSINDSAVTFSGLKLPWSMPISSQSQMSINLLFSEHRVVRFAKFPNSFGASPVTSFPSDMSAQNPNFEELLMVQKHVESSVSDHLREWSSCEEQLAKGKETEWLYLTPPIYLYQKGWGPLAAKGAEWPIKLEGLEGSKVKLEVGLGNSWSPFILGSLIDSVPAFHWSQDHQVCLAATHVVSQICSSLN